MGYTLIAEMRYKEEVVVICEDGPLDLYERIMDQFVYGDHIKRFAIYKGNELVKDKILEKPMERRKVR